VREILRHFLGGLCSTQGSEDSPTRATQAAGKKNAAAQKKKGTGLFKPVSCSAALSKITGISGKATRGTITKAVWAYIKKKVPPPSNGLEKGRQVSAERSAHSAWPWRSLAFSHVFEFPLHVALLSEKAQGLSKGRNVGKIDGIFGGGSMFKLTSAVSTPCQNF